MVFKNDPLESVDVSSTFDGVAVIQKYLQQEIEGQLREMFREDLPGIIHRLSQSWLAKTRDAAAAAAAAGALSSTTSSTAAPSMAGVHSRAPTAASAMGAPPKQPFSVPQPHQPTPLAARARSAHTGAAPTPEIPTQSSRSRMRKRSSHGTTNASTTASRTAVGVLSSSPSTLPPQSPLRQNGFSSSTGAGARPGLNSARSATAAAAAVAASQRRPALDRSKSTSASASASARSRSFVLPDADGQSSQTLRDIEEYDPTYGLRPDEVDLDRSLFKSGFSGLGTLLQNGHDGLGGLHALADENEDDDLSETESEVDDDRDGDGDGDWTAEVDRLSSQPPPHDIYGSLDEDDFDMQSRFPAQSSGRADAYSPHPSPPSPPDIDAEEEQVEDDDVDDDIDPFVSSAFGSEAASGYFGLDFGSRSRTIFDKKSRPSSAAATPPPPPAAVGLGGMEPPGRTYANQRAAAQVKASPLPPRNSLPSHSASHGHGQQRPTSYSRREDQQDHRGFPTPGTARHHDGFASPSPSPSGMSDRLSSPSRMSVARSLSGVGMGIGAGAGLGVAVGLGSGAGGNHHHVGSGGGGRSTPGQGTMHHRLAGAAAASVRPPSVAESVRSRGHMPRSVSASASASSAAAAAAAAAAKPRIYHVASRVQVPVLDDDDEARQLGFAGGPHRSGVSDGVASSSFDAPSSTRSSRTRAGQQQYLGGSRGTGTGTVRAPKSTRTGGAGTTGARTIRAPPSLGSSRDLGMPRWGEDMMTTEEEEEDDRQATLRVPPRPGAGHSRGALPSFDQQQQQQFAWAGHGHGHGHGHEQTAWGRPDGVDEFGKGQRAGRAAYWNGEVADEYEDDDDDDDLDLGRVSDLGQDDELDEVDELGGAYRSTGRTVHQRNTAHTLEHEGSTLSPSDGTGSSVLSGSGTRTNDGTGTGTGTSSSEQANSLTTLEPTPMDPRSSEFKRQLYREQYRVQTDDGF
ncbi:hypothetical protein CF328_g6940 [Tilletia controversa]|nr:hypothetical protein CF328_g6940 [Tilletia controversa]